jgi:hypothetical protein
MRDSIVLDKSFASEEALVAHLSDQNLEITNLDGISPEKFYEVSLRWLGCIVIHRHRWFEQNPQTKELETKYGPAHIGRFWTNVVTSFRFEEIPAGQMVMVQKKQAA